MGMCVGWMWLHTTYRVQLLDDNGNWYDVVSDDREAHAREVFMYWSRERNKRDVRLLAVTEWAEPADFA